MKTLIIDDPLIEDCIATLPYLGFWQNPYHDNTVFWNGDTFLQIATSVGYLTVRRKGKSPMTYEVNDVEDVVYFASLFAK